MQTWTEWKAQPRTDGNPSQGEMPGIGPSSKTSERTSPAHTLILGSSLQNCSSPQSVVLGYDCTSRLTQQGALIPDPCGTPTSPVVKAQVHPRVIFEPTATGKAASQKQAPLLPQPIRLFVHLCCYDLITK